MVMEKSKYSKGYGCLIIFSLKGPPFSLIRGGGLYRLCHMVVCNTKEWFLKSFEILICIVFAVDKRRSFSF